MEKLKALAESVRTELNLKYDRESVKFIEGFIERTKINLGETQVDGFINSLGAFIGQCIIENYGGEWKYDNETGVTSVSITDQNIAYPFGKVRKQFENGLEDSVYSFYNVIPIVFNIEKRK
ncbi:MAG: hypothetical protein JWN83_2106 [Chitinophagaceae bacterium]|nr:hypothetical protein [Chitinophagaceae bacterium]